LAVGGGAGYVLRKNVAEGKLASAEEKASRMIKEAEETIEAKKKRILNGSKGRDSSFAFRHGT
jgi:ribonuclease Y